MAWKRSNLASMLASRCHGTLYIGVTSNLIQRLYQHREGLIESFTKRYGVKRLVWFEMAPDMEAAILREKQLKKWNRDWKARLIERSNPDWLDLAIGLGFEPISTKPRVLRDALSRLAGCLDSRLRGNDGV